MSALNSPKVLLVPRRLLALSLPLFICYKSVQLIRVTETMRPLLIFDFDGTLIDSVPDLADAVNAMLGEFDKPMRPMDAVRGWVGNGARPLVARAWFNRTELTDAELNHPEVDTALDVFFSKYSDISGQKTVPYVDVDAGLHELKRAGFTLTLVTNKPMQFVTKILQSLGWQDLFSEVLGGDSLPQKKPDPAPLLYVCNKLGFDVSNAMMIGDSKNDILAGQNAGMVTLGVSYGYNYGQDIRDFKPSEAFDDFASLKDWLMTNDEN